MKMTARDFSIHLHSSLAPPQLNEGPAVRRPFEAKQTPAYNHILHLGLRLRLQKLRAVKGSVEVPAPASPKPPATG